MTTPTLLAFVPLVLFTCPAPATEERVLQEWTFDQAGDLRGWQPNGHVAEAAVTGGQLTCRTIGADPILELKPLLGLPATPWQFDVADSLACAACSYLR